MNNENIIIKSMEMYNLISDLEDRLASGQEVYNLDIDLMNRTKEKSKNFLSRELGIKVK